MFKKLTILLFLFSFVLLLFESSKIDRHPASGSSITLSCFKLIKNFLIADDIAKNENYELVKKLGEGGQGVVNLYREIQTEDLIVAKTFLPGKRRYFDKEERFYKEFSHLSGIPKFISASKRKMQILIKYESEITYADYSIKELNTIEDLKFKIVPLLDVAKTLLELHLRDVVYMDVKPQNILVNKNNKGILIDFGAVHFEASTAKMNKFTVMSPNNARDPYSSEYISQKFDVYGLGEIIDNLLFTLYMRNSTLEQDTTFKKIKALSQKALEKEAVNRISMKEFIESFEEILE